MEDHHVDRPEVEREQSPQLTGTNRSIGFFAKAGQPAAPPAACSAKPPHAWSTHLPPSHLLGLVAIARGQTPDPIPNSAVKTLCAHGTAAQAAEESVAARPKYPTLSLAFLVAINPTLAGWSSPVARQAHNLKVVGSNPTPATIQTGTPERACRFL